MPQRDPNKLQQAQQQAEFQAAQAARDLKRLGFENALDDSRTATISRLLSLLKLLDRTLKSHEKAGDTNAAIYSASMTYREVVVAELDRAAASIA